MLRIIPAAGSRRVGNRVAAAATLSSASSAQRALSSSAHPQQVPHQVQADFYRGGTSRGLLFRTNALSQYDVKERDAIICAASSPDPDGRQISGLGGGVSSLSKCAIIGRPGEGQPAQEAFSGHAFVDDVERSRDPREGWDVVYRFGQVPINDMQIDWGSTCGNLVAAVAQFSIDSGLINQKTLRKSFEQQASKQDDVSFVHPLRIIAANSGNIVTAHIPITSSPSPSTNGLSFHASRTGSARIAGVPGSYAPISIETPLPDPSAVLPSGSERNTIKLKGLGEIPVSLVDCGLPVIFVSASSLSIPPELLTAHPAELDAHTETMQKLEAVRRQGAQLSERVWNNFSPPAPKICVVAPRMQFKNTGGEIVKAGDIDLLIRSISVGNVHRTIPATTLSAVAAACAFPSSVVSEAIAAGRQGDSSAAPASVAESQGQGNVLSVTVGQPAGLSTASVKLSEGDRKPIGIVYIRTANRIISGLIDVPDS